MASTDRALPKGLCLLPPARACDKGNACYTCGMFATDATFTEVHQETLDRTKALVERRHQQHLQRTGQHMAESNVWLRERRLEIAALERILDRLHRLPDGQRSLQGGGVAALHPPASTRRDHQETAVVTAADHAPQNRIDRLATAARPRTARAEQHAEKTIRGMLRHGEQITFRAYTGAAACP